MPGGFDPYRRYNEEEYLAFCERTEERLEMYDGYIRVKDWDYVRGMAGGSVRHSKLVGRIYRILAGIAEGRGCEAFNSDIQIPNHRDTYVYPDATYVCAPEWIREETAKLANPLLVVEVLSPSTGEKDRTTKFDLYASYSSVRAILLVSSESVHVEAFERHGEHSWLYQWFTGREATVKLSELEIEFNLEELYRGVRVGDERPMPPMQVSPTN